MVLIWCGKKKKKKFRCFLNLGENKFHYKVSISNN